MCGPGIERSLARMTLADLWGVAGRMAARLEEIEITSPLKLWESDPAFIRERFSIIMQRMVMELRGISCLHLEDHVPDGKSIIASRSFGRPGTTLQEMEEAVASYIARAAEKMRRQGLATAPLGVRRNRPLQTQRPAAQRNARNPHAGRKR